MWCHTKPPSPKNMKDILALTFAEIGKSPYYPLPLLFAVQKRKDEAGLAGQHISMKEKKVTFEKMQNKTLVLYIHGKGGTVQEAVHYKSLFPHCDVVGLDYKAETL